MSVNKERLLMVFKTIDINGDGELDVAELTKAFEKTGKKPSITEIKSMIAEVDSNNSGTVNFDEFCQMVEKVGQGKLEKTTGIPSLITGAWEDYLSSINKPTPKNVPIRKEGKGGGEAQPEKPQGEKYVLKKKGVKKVVYNNLPPKKSLSDFN